ncbi:flavin monoamine oxidase family protein [Polymorphobacter sp.]|uniref:flavin monoamine oxidase family protein n=1 Tax=Polymorphobacter sp. TaxID=1909290 RepID=UPI003F712675
MALGRRAFLGSALAAPFIGGIAPRPAWGQTVADTIVIGGGLSGLAAMQILENEGQKVVLLEADRRLGGRAYTLDTPDGPFECGGATLGPLYGRLRSLAAMAGVALVDPLGRDALSYHINGQFLRPSEWQTSSANRLPAGERMLRPEQLEFKFVQQFNRITDLEDWNNPALMAYDIPLDSFLRQQGVSDEALRLIDITTNSVALSRTSALFQMREFARVALPSQNDTAREVYAAGSDGSYHVVKGGTSRLVEGIAGLMKGDIRTGAVVVGIDVQPDRVTVELIDGTRLQARHCICTIPFSTLRNVQINPPLRGDKLSAVLDAGYTSTTHVFAVPTKPYWEMDGSPAGLISDTIIERMFAGHDASGKVASLDIWLNGTAATAIDSLPAAERAAFVLAQLAQVRPSTEGAIEVVGTYSWGENPFIRGNKHVFGPGQIGRLYRAMAAPWAERLRFAGEHTRNWEAGMEAATESGQREAFAVLGLG